MKAINLPEPGDNFDNEEAVVTGWGRLSLDGPDPVILQEVRVITITNDECREKNYKDEDITDFMICAIGESAGGGACLGQTGPLQVPDRVRSVADASSLMP